MGGWMDGWMGGSKSRFKDCLQQSKMIGNVISINMITYKKSDQDNQVLF
jgi:hypothetical protein